MSVFDTGWSQMPICAYDWFITGLKKSKMRMSYAQTVNIQKEVNGQLQKISPEMWTDSTKTYLILIFLGSGVFEFKLMKNSPPGDADIVLTEFADFYGDGAMLAGTEMSKVTFQKTPGAGGGGVSGFTRYMCSANLMTATGERELVSVNGVDEVVIANSVDESNSAGNGEKEIQIAEFTLNPTLTAVPNLIAWGVQNSVNVNPSDAVTAYLQLVDSQANQSGVAYASPVPQAINAVTLANVAKVKFFITLADTDCFINATYRIRFFDFRI